MKTPTEILNYTGGLPWFNDSVIYLTKHGSHAYGTSRPDSDLDIKGVCVPPREYFVGFYQRFEQAVSPPKAEPDYCVFDVRKFFSLAADCNPNIIEVLFTDPADHLLSTKLGDKILAIRDQFLSRKAKHTFSGYAVSQLKRIQTHHRWLRNPPAAPPTRAEYGLPERTVIPADQLAAADSAIRKRLDEWNIHLDELDDATKIDVYNRIADYLVEIGVNDGERYTRAGRSLGYADNFLELLDQERRYKTRQTEWSQYQTWLKTRNVARAALESKYGFDTKHAMHLVRLLRMCREILETGKVIVKRPDAEELLAIRNGAWEYEKLLEWAQRQDKELDEVKSKSPLPNSCDKFALDIICKSVAIDKF